MVGKKEKGGMGDMLTLKADVNDNDGEESNSEDRSEVAMRRAGRRSTLLFFRDLWKEKHLREIEGESRYR